MRRMEFFVNKIVNRVNSLIYSQFTLIPSLDGTFPDVHGCLKAESKRIAIRWIRNNHIKENSYGV